MTASPVAQRAHLSSVPEIPGIKAEPELRNQFQREVADLLGRSNLAFPGAQPVSFARHHLEELKRRDYYLCEKTDGIRCLLYCDDDGSGTAIAYLIDRKNEYYFVQGLHLPIPDDEKQHHTKSLIDGELVNDRMPDGTVKLRFLVFDCLVLDGRSYMQKPLDKRIGAFQTFVYKPYKELFSKFPDEMNYQPFEMKMKEMEKPYGIGMMFRDKLPRLAHGNDGLVFTCKETFYVHGTDEHILKWKPAHENSVDFRLQLGDFPQDSDSASEDSYDYDAKPTWELLVNHGKDYRKFGDLYITEQEWESMKNINQQLDGRIIECFRDEQGRWRYKHESDGSPRFRDDKRDANYIDVVRNVLQSIEDGVAEADLIAASAGIHRAWKSRHPEEDQPKRKSPEDADAARGLKRARATPS